MIVYEVSDCRHKFASMWKRNMVSIESLISKAMSKTRGTTGNTFDQFILEIQGAHDSPCHSLQDLHQNRSTKAIGDLWESFCLLYLQHIRGMKDVWLLKDVPADVLIHLGMRRQDIGIDIVAHDGQGYYAIQAKYRTRSRYKSKTYVTWKELSTFHALTSRTGPWVKCTVMCNCDGVSWKGLKTERDSSICIKRFQALTLEQWDLIAGNPGHMLSDAKVERPSVDSMREARLRFFEPK